MSNAKWCLSNFGAALVLTSFGIACSDSEDGASSAKDGSSTAGGGVMFDDCIDEGDVSTAANEDPATWTHDGVSATEDSPKAAEDAPTLPVDCANSAGSDEGSPEACESVTVLPRAPTDGVNLGTAANYVILAKSGISTVPVSAVTGNIAVSPAAATYITGFSLKADATNTFSTSTQVNGKVYAANYAVPSPCTLTSAVGDMETAFTDAAGRAPDVTELGAGDISGMTLGAGVYKWGTGLLIATSVTLTGSGTDVWIFQVSKDFTMSSGAAIVLAGGAVPKNITWQVAGLVDLGTTAHCEGVILTKTSITLRTGSSVNGRLLAQTAVNIDASTVTEPAN